MTGTGGERDVFRDRDSVRGSCACRRADGLSRRSREARFRARDSPVNRLCFARHARDGDGVHVVRVEGLSTYALYVSMSAGVEEVRLHFMWRMANVWKTPGVVEKRPRQP